VNEPTIIINGVRLTESQAMTVRVAIESFASDMNSGLLGKDVHGKALAQGYLARVNEIRKVMFK